jgi:alpha-L-rhamnosidase
VLETLAQNGSPNAVFDIVNSTVYPGWGFMIDQGATSIWETWKESDNTFSNSHPMFGTVSEWYYRWLAGIRPDPKHPGFKEFTLTPTIPDGLEYVNATYHSPYGEIVSNWRKEHSGNYRYEMTIPEGSMANVELPISIKNEVEIKKNQSDFETEDIEGLDIGKFKLGAGAYVITVLTESK